jgi:4-hydroxy-3-polyprenylbenzoate decarboxylase
LRICVGISGASGAIYAQRLLERLQPGGHTVHVTLTRYGNWVWKEELEIDFKDWVQTLRWDGEEGSSRLVIDNVNDLYAEPSWGLKKFDGYLVVPCSSRTLSAIHGGLADNLITRFGDVALKERRPLVLLLREAPLHELHLARMTELARAGAIVLPASPGFYLKPKTIDDLVDFMVDKILSYLPEPAAPKPS